MGFFRLSFPAVLPNWADILTFDVGNTTYTVNSSQYYLYVNTNNQNVTITIPANTEPSRGFNIRKINDSADILTIITDDANCSINGTTNLSTNSVLVSLSVLMGLDRNYWSTGGSGGGGSTDLTYYVNTSQLSANLSVYPLASFLTSNYINTVQLSSNLGNYPNNTQLTNNLAPYATNTYLTTNFPNNSQLSSNIVNFITGAQLSGNLTTTNTYLTTNYPNNTQLSANLGSYTLTSFVSGNYPNNSQLSSNLANYPNTTQLTNNLANYQSTIIANSGIVSNSAGLFVNANNGLLANSTGLFVIANTGISVNSSGIFSTVTGTPGGANTQIQYNNSGAFGACANLTFNGIILSLGNGSVNVTINSTTFSGTSLTANNATNLGGTAAAGYQTTAGLSANVAILTANNSTYLGGVVSTSYMNTSGSYVISGFHTYGNATINVVVTNTSIAIGAINSTAVGILVANNLLTIGNSSVNATINSTTFSGTSLTANNATNLGGTAAAGYQTTAGLSSNVATLTANNTSYVGAVTAVNVVSNAQLSANLVPYVNTQQFWAWSGNSYVYRATLRNYQKTIVSSNGYVSNSTGLFLIANTGITINSAGIFAPSGGVGTVTNVAPANGIMTSPNPITGAGNVYAVAGAGVVVNTGGINVLANNGIVSNTSGVFVNANTGLVVNSSGVFSTVGSVGGANTQIQYNNSGSFGASANLTFDVTTTKLSLGNSSINVTANNISLSLQGSVKTGNAVINDHGSFYGNTTTVVNKRKGIIQCSVIYPPPSGNAACFSDLANLGVNWVRTDFPWFSFCPSSNTFDGAYVTIFDQYVANLTNLGINVLGIIDFCPHWASGNSSNYYMPPTNASDYGNFCSMLVNHYAPMGVHHWEIWNEPNMVGFWNPAANAQKYTALLQSGYTAIKAADPTAYVIAGGSAESVTDATSYWANDFLTYMYANGAAGYFDALCFHPYTGTESPRTNFWFTTMVPNLRQIMCNNGDQNKPIWFTEVGFNANNTVMTEAQQATLLQDLYSTTATMPYVGPVFYFQTYDLSNTEQWGIVRNDNSKRPAYYTYQNLPSTVFTGTVSDSSRLFGQPANLFFANTGLVQNTSGIFVNANTGLVSNSSGLFVSPVGSNTQIQYYGTGGVFAGANGLTYLSGVSTNNVTVTGENFNSVPLTVTAGVTPYVWSNGSVIANYPLAIQLAVGAVFPNNSFLSVGGMVPGVIKTANTYRYDPSPNTWTQVANYPITIWGSGAAAIGNGSVLVFGGASAAGNTANTYRYDPGANAWTQVANYPFSTGDGSSFQGLCGAALSNGSVIGVGGASANSYRYDPGANTWTQIANYPIVGGSAAAVTLSNGFILVIGGASGGITYSNCCCYNPGANTWSAIANYPITIGASAVALMSNGSVLSMGGLTGTDYIAITPTANTYRYDPGANVWTQVANYPLPAMWFNAGTLANGNIIGWGCSNNFFLGGPGTVNCYSYSLTSGASANLLQVANSSSVVFAINSSGCAVGNGAGLTSNNALYLGGVISGSYINTSGSYITTGVLTFGNSTVNAIINSTALSLDTINSTAIGIILANSYIMIGNSSINATMNASTISTSGPNYTVISTTTTAIPLTVKGAASASANLFQVSNSGSVVFAVNSSGVAVGNGVGLNIGATTYSIVTGSRAIGTTYQNTSGKLIFVMASASRNVASGYLYGSISTASGGLPAGTSASPNSNTVIGLAFSPNSSGFSVVITFFVLPGYYYNISTSSPDTSSITLYQWTEYTMPFG